MHVPVHILREAYGSVVFLVEKVFGPRNYELCSVSRNALRSIWFLRKFNFLMKEHFEGQQPHQIAAVRFGRN